MDMEVLEALALSEDRASALAQLIPGTEDYFFYHCLHCQTSGRLKDVAPLLAAWINQLGRTSRVEEIENRQALLSYTLDRDASLKYLTDKLRLRFDAQREIERKTTTYPSKLDASLISREVLTRNAFQRHAHSLKGLTVVGLAQLDTKQLDAQQLGQLLDRMPLPHFPDLVALVLKDLKSGAKFGSRKIHERLTADQLTELAAKNSELNSAASFVNARLVRLRPGSDEDWQNNVSSREAYLNRLWDFVAACDPVFNSLKAHVFYHMLAFEREQGRYPRDRFLAYLRLPRQALAIPYLKQGLQSNYRIDLKVSHNTGLAPVGNDEELVRDYLVSFFINDEDYNGFCAFIDRAYLTRLFAASKLMSCAAPNEKWVALLDDPVALRDLREQVELELASVNPGWYGADEAVTLHVDVKNVTNLVVKVFEINTLNFFRQHGREVDAAIDLDGLVAGKVFHYTYDAPPIQRVRRSYAFEMMDKPGVYVVDLIGNGKSSRALIRKGTLRFSQRMGAAGHVFKVFNDRGELLPQATLLMDNREYRPHADGAIVVPYTARPRSRQALLCCGRLTSVISFQHLGETYRLSAGVLLERESLLSHNQAPLILRPSLTLNHIPVSLDLVESPGLLIETWDRHNTASSRDISAFELSSKAESTLYFEVPGDLQRLRVTLRGRVKNLCDGKTVDLSDSHEMTCNSVEMEMRTLGLHLARSKQGFVLYLLGKSGEPRANRQVTLSLRHREFVDMCTLTLQTDERGRIELGTLEHITALRAVSPPGVNRSWNLHRDLCTWPNSVHASSHEPIRLPLFDLKTDLSETSLLEKRAGFFFRSCHDRVTHADGYLILKPLTPGDYQLFHAGACVDIRISVARADAGWLRSDKRWLQYSNGRRLQVTGLECRDGQLVVGLAGAGPATRIHLSGTRFAPSSAAMLLLKGPNRPDSLQIVQARPLSHYQSGRDIGDEYRYILERQFAPKRPGNMLNRPDLLLNPWAVGKTATEMADAAAAGAFGEEAASALPPPSPRANPGPKQCKDQWQGDNNLDFLPRPLVLANLRPDDDGVLRLPLSDFEGVNLVTLLVIDGDSSVQRQLCLDEVDMAPRDLRLADGLNPKEDFCEHKQTAALNQGDRLKLVNSTITRFQGYASLADVFHLLSSLSGDKTLPKFAFILGWPELDADEKCNRYGEFACHELNFFLQRKDPAFFKSVVQPYLCAKKNKTFLDHYLLESDLSAYLTPWAYARLNIVERILLCRCEGEAVWTIRHVDDECDLLKPSAAEENQLFQAALKGKMDSQPPMAVPAQPGRLAMSNRMAYAPPKKRGGQSFARQADDEGDAFLSRSAASEDELDLALREEVAPAYFPMDKTQEWAENNYYRLPLKRQVASLVRVNRFWRDFAHHNGKGLFLSDQFPRATANFTEVMFALSVLDLPFKAGEQKLTRSETSLEVQAGSPAIYFHRQIKPKAIWAEDCSVSVTQDYYRHDDKQDRHGQGLKFVSGEFLTHTIYCCHVAVSNLGTREQKLDLLLQIPNGAMLVGKEGALTDSRPLSLAPYESRAISYAFYFPKAGRFSHYPACVARDERLVAKATETGLTVVEQFSQMDQQSWPYLSQHGTQDQVLRFLEDHNLGRLDLNKMAWRLADRGFYDKVLRLLEHRHHFDARIWSYAVKHDDPKRIEQFLLNRDPFSKRCGFRLSSPLLNLDPVADHRYQYLTYAPLMNARSQRLGKRVELLNSALARQYSQFLKVTTYMDRPDNATLLEAASYLFLQDRVEEGLALFKRVDSDCVTRLQYDYLHAYTAFFSDDPQAARAIAQPYRDYPVPRWQKRFGAVLTVLDEMEGAAHRLVDDKDRLEKQNALAATQPSFEMELSGSQVTLHYRNLSHIRVNYYLMDIELLFSRQPFVQQKSDRFSIIRPNGYEDRNLPKDDRLCFQLPEAFCGVNAVVEGVADGIRKAQVSYANRLRVHLAERYGQLTVCDDQGKPLPAIYVKVFAKQRGGDETFYKDGYSDHRGCFDYAGLSTNHLDRVKRFSILVLSEAHGSVIQEVDPPKP